LNYAIDYTRLSLFSPPPFSPHFDAAITDYAIEVFAAISMRLIRHY